MKSAGPRANSEASAMSLLLAKFKALSLLAIALRPSVENPDRILFRVFAERLRRN
jgi:hypothetical protein